MPNVKINTPWLFMVNAGALGDIVAATPTLKYAIENIWNKPDSIYNVMIKEYFIPLLHFVPISRIRILGKEGFESKIATTAVWLNDIKDSPNGPTADINPLRMSLIDYASIKLLGTVLPLEHKNYPKISTNGTNISKFKLPERYVCICATEVNKNRALPAAEIVKLSEYLLSVGITPVYLGKSERPFETFGAGTQYGVAPKAIPGVIDLIDKTSLLEAAKVMAKSECVVGADTGLIHLAACSDVRIILLLYDCQTRSQNACTPQSIRMELCTNCSRFG